MLLYIVLKGMHALLSHSRSLTNSMSQNEFETYWLTKFDVFSSVLLTLSLLHSMKVIWWLKWDANFDEKLIASVLCSLKAETDFSEIIWVNCIILCGNSAMLLNISSVVVIWYDFVGYVRLWSDKILFA